MAQRRASARQIAAEYRRYQQERGRTIALTEIARIEAELEQSLHSWRAAFEVSPRESHRQQLQRRSFVRPQQPPATPDYADHERKHLQHVLLELRGKDTWGRWLAAHWLLIPGCATLVAAFLSGAAAISVALVSLALWLGIWLRTFVRMRPAWLQEAGLRWSVVRAQLESDHAARLVPYEARCKAWHTAWEEAETQRIAHVQALLEGQVDAMRTAITARVEGLDLPFESACTAVVDDEDHVLIDIDLPEIEDVVPEHRYTVNKKGEVKTAKRKVAERNEAYADLVSGIALAVAAQALSAAPTLAFVTIAGRTQRKARDSSEVIDTYILEVKLPRASVERLDAGKVSPQNILRHHHALFDVSASGVVKKIPDPAWTRGLQRRMAPPPPKDAPNAPPEKADVRSRPQPQAPQGSGILGLTVLCGLCVLTASVCSKSSPSSASRDPVQTAPPHDDGQAQEAQRVAALRDAARALVQDIKPYDGTLKSTRRATRDAIVVARQAQPGCESAALMKEELLAKGHDAAAQRFEQVVEKVVCSGGRLAKVLRK